MQDISLKTKISWLRQYYLFSQSSSVEWLENLEKLIPGLPFEYSEKLPGVTSFGLKIRPSVFIAGSHMGKKVGLGSVLRRLRTMFSIPQTAMKGFFKIKYVNIFSELFDLLKERNVYVFFFQRNNVLKQAISIYRRMEQKKSQFTGDTGPSVIDVKCLRRYLNSYENCLKMHRLMRAAADKKEVPYGIIAYEDILNDKAGTFTKFFERIGVPVSSDMLADTLEKGRYKKSTSDNLREALINYEEVLEYFRGTRYECYFQDIPTMS